MGVNVEFSRPSHGLIRQGDLLLVPVPGLPEGAHLQGRGRVVLAKGEATGHAHLVDDQRASVHRVRWAETTYLRVVGDEPVSLVHEEHDLLRVRPGVYEVRRQREYVPRRPARRVAD